MTFVSYAQNFEDVLLWRVLKGVRGGFYIDAGAAHPDIDSVTKAFYDRGWNGINVEPVAAFALRLEAARPRDLTLRVALGEAEGSAPFFVVQGTGLSTLEPAVAEDFAAQGMVADEHEVRVTTLAVICRDHAPADIHFLKIDVEGAERAVLAGGDFTAFRPWIILVEATRPMSTEETHDSWEPILLDADYRFVWFDGLNRFYVAAEREAALGPGFRTPPNVFDDFLRAADTEWARRIHEAEASARELKLRAALAEERVVSTSQNLLRSAVETSVQRETAKHRAEDIQKLDHDIARLTMERDRNHLTAHHEHIAGNEARAFARAADERRAMTEAALTAAQARLAGIQASTSWRITGPLRRAIRLLRRGRAGEAFHGGAPALPVPPAPPVGPAPLPEVTMAPQLPQAVLEAPPVPHWAPRPPGAIRTVHQFHSGSAVGDAITNAMLLTRRLLRGVGYHSEIFVEHLDPGLAEELRPIDELPLHAGYVLIVRHSMGYDAFTRIAALPAPKVLLYHNITPPEFLEGHPNYQAYSVLGRKQLAQWRPHVAAALADSEFNAIELRRLGFDPVGACTLLFDEAKLASTAHAPAAPGSLAPVDPEGARAPFTILFVGRVTAAKAQADLIGAYAVFRASFGLPSRLVIVGRLDDGVGYVAAVQAAVDEAGLAGHVIVTDLVSDEAMQGWYASADLYVSLSLHEGFGVPLVEAAARGIPVLSWPSGAVPYTLGDPAGLLLDRGPDYVAARLLELARDPVARIRLGSRQRADVQRFRLDRQMPALVHALALAGAAPPPDAAARPALAANLRVTVTGHASGTYSLAAVNRALVLALDDTWPGRARLAPVEGHAPAALTDLPLADAPRIRALANRAPFGTGPDIVVSNHYPVHVPTPRGDVTMALFYWEESVVPRATVAGLSRDFDAVLAPTRFVAKVLRDSGLRIPVHVIGQALDLGPYAALGQARAASAALDAPALASPLQSARMRAAHTTFLHVSSCFPRKGADVLLAAYSAAFRASDPVTLVIKTFPNPHNDVAARIATLRQADPGAPAIKLVDRDLDTDDLLALYRRADAMVLPSRGEGFNMPAAEAMAAGLPLIVTGAGGHMDFCDDGNARLLRWSSRPSGTHLASANSLWIEPDEDDLVDALREADAAHRRGDPALAAQVARARDKAASLSDGGAVARRVAETGLQQLLTPPPTPLRMVWVTSWDVRCGVAEYARHLQNNLRSSDAGKRGIGELVVLADTRTAPAESTPEGAPRVRPVWPTGIDEAIPAITRAIAQEDPQAVMVQHQPGLFSFPALERLLRHHAVRDRVVTVTLHNAQVLVEMPVQARAGVVEALRGIGRIFVHTLIDLGRLASVGLGENVMLMPQGAPPPGPIVPLRAIGEADAPRIGCYGFFLPGKGLPQLVEAASLLRARWPRLKLRLVNAEYDHAYSRQEIEKCQALAESLGIADAIEWHTDFVSNEESLALLAGCDVVALPTQDTKEGSSASLRMALASRVPVMVSSIPFFDEAGDAVARAPGTSAAAVAKGLVALLTDLSARQSIQEAAGQWLAERDWASVAALTGDIVTGLVAQRAVEAKTGA